MKKVVNFLIFLILLIFGLNCYGDEKIIMSDSVGVFFDEKKEIKHYSNIPFYQMDNESKDLVDLEQLKSSKERFIKYVNILVENGYNSISIDDVNHVVNMKEIFLSNSKISRRNQIYIDYYQKLLKIAKSKGLKVFIISDMQFYNTEIEKLLGDISINNKNLISFNKKVFERLFIDLGDLDGVIIRIGEGGNAYNNNDYKSKVIYKSTKDVNNFLKEILPIFEKYNKKLIFRTWTIGLGDIGDLINNKITYEKTFEGIKSNNLIISIKHTPGDFFWFDKLNPTIGIGDLKQIVEIQVRKEYEGGGDFVNFFSSDYQKLYKEINSKKNVIGVWNWNQTGGWGWGKNIIFNFGFNFWNELNFFVVGDILKGENNIKSSISKFLDRYNFSIEQKEVLSEIIISSREIIKKGFYIDDFRKKDIKVGNIILPPLLRIWWDKTTTSPIILSIIFNNIDNKEISLKESEKYLLIQKNEINTWEKVSGKRLIDKQIYESLLNRYYIFEINYLFKKDFINYFETGKKLYSEEVNKKIKNYETFLKNKDYFNYDFSEVKSFYRSDCNIYINIFFLINIIMFFASIMLAYNYNKLKKHNKIAIISLFIISIFSTILSTFFFIGKDSIFWVFTKLNYVISLIITSYFLILVGILSKILKIKVRFNLGKIIYLVVLTVLILELVIVFLSLKGEWYFWKALGFILLNGKYIFILYFLLIIYLIIFFIFGLYLLEKSEYLRTKKIIIVLIFLLFLAYLGIIYSLDYKKSFFNSIAKNYIPSYFIKAGTDYKEFF